MNRIIFNAMVTRITLSIFIVSTAISCGFFEGDGELCDCSTSIEIKNKTVLKEKSLPDDLTCVVANSGTYKVNNSRNSISI